MSKDYSIVQHPDGWAAQGHGNSRASAVKSTQAEAYDAARSFAANAGGGEISIHGTDGKIRDKNTIAPAKDPRNIPG
ncbi:DUF2188 domain-containing protein [Agrococcus sediminis]|uniref:DUF2188 domain-containing protein n=1 Tax=Agrococcus sediminis TaxID=2599924 RepID=A0A5M8QFX5_9MICO|nr:DUF2188 domain-containing protein [Agrococcus sediminis]KAA6434935.1 DUF2188 domain-containing protein [Agrococcus sediminis]